MRRRPGYLISLSDGSVHQTTDEYLHRQQHEASPDPIMPGPSPPSVSTSPPKNPPSNTWAGQPLSSSALNLCCCSDLIEVVALHMLMPEGVQD